MVKYPPATAEDARRSLGVRNGNPLQYSCLESPWTEKLLEKPRTPGTSSEERAIKVSFVMLMRWLSESISGWWLWAVCCLVTQSCLTLSDPANCSLPGSSVHGDSPDKNTRVGCHALLQGIIPTQGSNPGLPLVARIAKYQSYSETSGRDRGWTLHQ